MNNIILIDDNKTFSDSFVNEAAAKNLAVSPKPSLQGLKQILPALAHKYAAVVLDIKCLITDDQSKEDASFIGAALKFIDITTPGFPRFILTGDDTEFEHLKRYYPNERMFLKNPDDLADLFKELQYCVANAEPLRLKRENPVIFDAFERGLLAAAKETNLLNILKNYGETNPANFRGIVGDVREMHEEIYKALNRRNKNLIGDQFINGNGSPTFTAPLHRHLEGNPDRQNNYNPTTTVYQDSTISTSTKFIHLTCSEVIHGTSKTQYHISPYTIRALINALMEMIIWSKQY